MKVLRYNTIYNSPVNPEDCIPYGGTDMGEEFTLPENRVEFEKKLQEIVDKNNAGDGYGLVHFWLVGEEDVDEALTFTTVNGDLYVADDLEELEYIKFTEEWEQDV